MRISRPLPRRLTLATLLLAASTATAAAPLAAQQAESAQMEADMKEVLAYRLTDATFATLTKVQDNIYATLKANPDLARKYATPQAEAGEAQSLDGIARFFDRVPEMKQAIVKAGLTPRQYLVASMALFQAAMADAVMQMPGADRSQLTATVQSNAAFLKAHKSDFDRLQARSREIEALSRTVKDEGGDANTAPPDSAGASRR